MKEKKHNLQKEQGSVQRQTQKNEHYENADAANKQESGDQYGIVPVPKGEKKESDQQKSGNRMPKNQPDLKGIDDEKIIPGIKRKHSPWNSIDFEADDFFGGLVPA